MAEEETDKEAGNGGTAGRAARRKPQSRRKAGGAAAAANADGTRLGVLGAYIGFHLRMAQDASFRAFARHTGMRDLKPGRFAAMTVIANNPGITQADLGRAIARDKSSVTPLIQELERRGLVTRQRSPGDRRSVALTLTETGQDTLHRLMAHAAEHDRRLDEIVGAHKPEFIKLLKKIADDLT